MKIKTRSRASVRARAGGTGNGSKSAKPTDAAREHYHREKARRARRVPADNELMAAARREYLALLESEAAKGKGGRPKKKPVAQADGFDGEDEASDE